MHVLLVEDLPIHLLFPFGSSVLVVIGLMLLKTAQSRGISAWTAMILLSWVSALLFPVLLLRGGQPPSVGQLWQPAVIGALFMLGQLLTFLAVKWGDVSIAAPVLGLKVLMVPAISILLVGATPGWQIWQAAALATVGIICVQWTDGKVDRSRVLQSIAFAAGAALSMTIFDLLIQRWSADWSASYFLPIAFLFTAILSCFFLPVADRPRDIVADRKLWIPLLVGSILMAVQAMGMTATLAIWGDASRVNIVYSLRGLWGVALTWLVLSIGGAADHGDHQPSHSIMLTRFVGAVLIGISVVIAIL